MKSDACWSRTLCHCGVSVWSGLGTGHFLFLFISVGNNVVSSFYHCVSLFKLSQMSMTYRVSLVWCKSFARCHLSLSLHLSQKASGKQSKKLFFSCSIDFIHCFCFLNWTAWLCYELSKIILIFQIKMGFTIFLVFFECDTLFCIFLCAGCFFGWWQKLRLHSQNKEIRFYLSTTLNFGFYCFGNEALLIWRIIWINASVVEHVYLEIVLYRLL